MERLEPNNSLAVKREMERRYSWSLDVLLTYFFTIGSEVNITVPKVGQSLANGDLLCERGVQNSTLC